MSAAATHRLIAQAATLLAACARPAVSLGPEATTEQLAAALTQLVSAAELFGCQPSFWRSAAEAAALLGREADAAVYRGRFGADV